MKNIDIILSHVIYVPIIQNIDQLFDRRYLFYSSKLEEFNFAKSEAIEKRSKNHLTVFHSTVHNSRTQSLGEFFKKMFQRRNLKLWILFLKFSLAWFLPELKSFEKKT